MLDAYHRDLKGALLLTNVDTRELFHKKQETNLCALNVPALYKPGCIGGTLGSPDSGALLRGTNGGLRHSESGPSLLHPRATGSEFLSTKKKVAKNVVFGSVKRGCTEGNGKKDPISMVHEDLANLQSANSNSNLAAASLSSKQNRKSKSKLHWVSVRRVINEENRKKRAEKLEIVSATPGPCDYAPSLSIMSSDKKSRKDLQCFGSFSDRGLLDKKRTYSVSPKKEQRNSMKEGSANNCIETPLPIYTISNTLTNTFEEFEVNGNSSHELKNQQPGIVINDGMNGLTHGVTGVHKDQCSTLSKLRKVLSDNQNDENVRHSTVKGIPSSLGVDSPMSHGLETVDTIGMAGGLSRDTVVTMGMIGGLSRDTMDMAMSVPISVSSSPTNNKGKMTKEEVENQMTRQVLENHIRSTQSGNLYLATSPIANPGSQVEIGAELGAYIAGGGNIPSGSLSNNISLQQLGPNATITLPSNTNYKYEAHVITDPRTQGVKTRADSKERPCLKSRDNSKERSRSKGRCPPPVDGLDGTVGAFRRFAKPSVNTVRNTDISGHDIKGSYDNFGNYIGPSGIRGHQILKTKNLKDTIPTTDSKKNKLDLHIPFLKMDPAGMADSKNGDLSTVISDGTIDGDDVPTLEGTLESLPNALSSTLKDLDEDLDGNEKLNNSERHKSLGDFTSPRGDSKVRSPRGEDRSPSGEHRRASEAHGNLPSGLSPTTCKKYDRDVSLERSREESQNNSYNESHNVVNNTVRDNSDTLDSYTDFLPYDPLEKTFGLALSCNRSTAVHHDNVAMTETGSLFRKKKIDVEKGEFTKSNKPKNSNVSTVSATVGKVSTIAPITSIIGPMTTGGNNSTISNSILGPTLGGSPIIGGNGLTIGNGVVSPTSKNSQILPPGRNLPEDSILQISERNYVPEDSLLQIAERNRRRKLLLKTQGTSSFKSFRRHMNPETGSTNDASINASMMSPARHHPSKDNSSLNQSQSQQNLNASINSNVAIDPRPPADFDPDQTTMEKSLDATLESLKSLQSLRTVESHGSLTNSNPESNPNGKNYTSDTVAGMNRKGRSMNDSWKKRKYAAITKIKNAFSTSKLVPLDTNLVSKEPSLEPLNGSHPNPLDPQNSRWLGATKIRDGNFISQRGAPFVPTNRDPSNREEGDCVYGALSDSSGISHGCNSTIVPYHHIPGNNYIQGTESNEILEENLTGLEQSVPQQSGWDNARDGNQDRNQDGNQRSSTKALSPYKSRKIDPTQISTTTFSGVMPRIDSITLNREDEIAIRREELISQAKRHIVDVYGNTVGNPDNWAMVELRKRQKERKREERRKIQLELRNQSMKDENAQATVQNLPLGQLPNLKLGDDHDQQKRRSTFQPGDQIGEESRPQAPGLTSKSGTTIQANRLTGYHSYRGVNVEYVNNVSGTNPSHQPNLVTSQENPNFSEGENGKNEAGKPKLPSFKFDGNWNPKKGNFSFTLLEALGAEYYNGENQNSGSGLDKSHSESWQEEIFGETCQRLGISPTQYNQKNFEEVQTSALISPDSRSTIKVRSPLYHNVALIMSNQEDAEEIQEEIEEIQRAPQKSKDKTQAHEEEVEGRQEVQTSEPIPNLSEEGLHPISEEESGFNTAERSNTILKSESGAPTHSDHEGPTDVETIPELEKDDIQHIDEHDIQHTIPAGMNADFAGSSSLEERDLSLSFQTTESNQEVLKPFDRYPGLFDKREEEIK